MRKRQGNPHPTSTAFLPRVAKALAERDAETITEHEALARIAAALADHEEATLPTAPAPANVEVILDGQDPVVIELPFECDPVAIYFRNADTGKLLAGVDLMHDHLHVGHWPDGEEWVTPLHVSYADPHPEQMED